MESDEERWGRDRPPTQKGKKRRGFRPSAGCSWSVAVLLVLFVVPCFLPNWGGGLLPTGIPLKVYSLKALCAYYEWKGQIDPEDWPHYLPPRPFYWSRGVYRPLPDGLPDWDGGVGLRGERLAQSLRASKRRHFLLVDKSTFLLASYVCVVDIEPGSGRVLQAKNYYDAP